MWSTFSRSIGQVACYFGLHTKLLFQTSRFTPGSSLQLTNPFTRLRASFGMAAMYSLLLQITFARDVFLISSSWQAVNAVLVVCEEAFGSFSNQNRSPTLKSRNCSAMRHWNVGPNTPPFVDSLGGSSSPKERKNFRQILSIHVVMCSLLQLMIFVVRKKDLRSQATLKSFCFSK